MKNIPAQGFLEILLFTSPDGSVKIEIYQLNQKKTFVKILVTNE